MIENDQQYRITLQQACRFRAAIIEFDARADAQTAARLNIDPRLLQAERDGMESQLADLEAEIAQYRHARDAAER